MTQPGDITICDQANQDAGTGDIRFCDPAAEPQTGDVKFCGDEDPCAAVTAGDYFLAGPDAPETGDTYTITGGIPPYTWSITGGGTINGDGNTAQINTGGACGTGEVRVTDSCGTLVIRNIRYPDGQWVLQTEESNVGCDTNCVFQADKNFCCIYNPYYNYGEIISGHFKITEQVSYEPETLKTDPNYDNCDCLGAPQTLVLNGGICGVNAGDAWPAVRDCGTYDWYPYVNQRITYRWECP